MTALGLIRASCKCTAPPMLVAGVLVCGACHAAIKAAQPPKATHYTSATNGVRPFGWSSRRFREYLAAHLIEIDGAQRIGPKRGRGVVYSAPVEAFHAFIEREKRAPRTNVVHLDVEGAITRAGYRLTRAATR